MNLLQYKTSLKTKLSILVTIAVMLVVIALGLYFDNVLKKNALANAHTRILHGYQRLAYNLKNIESSLKDGISFIQSEEQMPASVELINNYQDKNNYNTYLIDEEKKSIASQLLNRVKFSFNDDIALYDKNDELIAFVVKEKEGYQLGYISYIDSQARLFNRYEHKDEFNVSSTLQYSPNISLRHIAIYDPNEVTKMSLITYHRLGDRIVIKSHQNIIDKDSNLLIGHIEMSRILDEDYFTELSQTLNLDIKHSFAPSLATSAQMLEESFDTGHLNVSQNKENYSVILKQAGFDGSIYYLANMNKTNFNLLLNKSRTQFLIILALVTFLILLLMRYIINLSLDQPLSALMKQIDKIKNQDYSGSMPISTGDELETVSTNINKLALTVKERESSLKKSMEEQVQLSALVRDSESQLRSLIQTLPDLVWLKDANGIYLSCNKKFERLYGAKESEIIGKTDYDFVNKELADSFRKHDKAAMAAGKATMNEEEIIFADDGHKEIVETIKTPMLAQDGSLIGVLGIARDVTERKLQEEVIRRTQKMDALGKLTGGIAHDYNNMLGVMLGYAELLKDMLTEQPVLQDYVDEIMHAGDRGAKLTKKLLSFSRQEASDAQVLDINTALQEEQHMLEKTLTARIKLEFKLEKNLWTVCLDESELEDAVLNLCINAMHAMEHNGQLIIETSNKIINAIDGEQLELEPGDYVQLCITDTGCGLDEKAKEKIFDPFYSTKGEKGTGLGLTQVYGFIKRSGGAIKVISKLEHGSRFIIYFPRYLGEDFNIDKSKSDIENNPSLKGKGTILVVDDESSLLDLANKILSNHGYHVFCAEHAKQALEILENESIDMLISDVIMPDMDGYELASIVQEKYPAIKIQLVSGFSGEHDVNNILSENLLQKPYTAQSLLKKVQTLLQ